MWHIIFNYTFFALQMRCNFCLIKIIFVHLLPCNCCFLASGVLQQFLKSSELFSYDFNRIHASRNMCVCACVCVAATVSVFITGELMI